MKILNNVFGFVFFYFYSFAFFFMNFSRVNLICKKVLNGSIGFLTIKRIMKE